MTRIMLQTTKMGMEAFCGFDHEPSKRAGGSEKEEYFTRNTHKEEERCTSQYIVMFCNVCGKVLPVQFRSSRIVEVSPLVCSSSTP